MTKRFKDIEVSADTGEVRLYITDNDYTEYTSEKLLNLLNKQEQRIQELEEEINQLNADYETLKEELRATRKNRDKLIKKYNNKIKKLKRDKHIIFSTINRFVNKYEEKAEVIRFKKPNTPDDYINQGRLRMLADLMNVLESYEVQEE